MEFVYSAMFATENINFDSVSCIAELNRSTQFLLFTSKNMTSVCKLLDFVDNTQNYKQKH